MSTLDNIIIIIFISALGITSILFLFLLIRKQRKIIELGRAKTLAEITILENERQRIAADLHDEIGPVLSAVKLVFATVEKSSKDRDTIERGTHLIDDLINRIRDVSNNLMPTVLSRKGVIIAIQEFIANISQTSNIQINWRHNEIPELSKDKAINLYRIVLEIIHNTLKHSQASILNISLVASNQKLILHTTDNGIGFNLPKMINKNLGLGLMNLMNRVEVMEGEMDIVSKPGNGTKFIIEIPLKNNI